MTISTAEKLAKIHQRSLQQFNKSQTACYEERKQCVEDRRFYSIAGAQWEGALGDQFENSPKFEFNKVHLAVIRIINEYRNNRITVDFTAKDGSNDDDLADTCDGLYRADEQDSGAQESYDNAFEEAVGGGFGAFRLCASYEDEEDDDNDHQRIRFDPIFDADSCVYFDVDAKRQDKSDATRCWVLSPYSYDAFEEEFGEDPASWPKEVNSTEFDWFTPDVVYVAEYYEIEEVKESVYIFEGLDPNAEEMRVPEAELTPEKLEFLKAVGFKQVGEKKAKRKKVHKYLMSGSGILEDCGYIAGNCIPVIPVYGKRWFVDGIERYMGHVRLAKDAQRLKNMQLSRLGEISALSPVEKPIFTRRQVAGLEQYWADDPIKRYPFGLVNDMEDANGQPTAAGPIGYTKSPNLPPAMAALLQLTEQDMSDILGNAQAGEQLQPNMSGKAVELIQTRLDMQVFIYMSNFAKAMRRAGEVWLSMARDIYVEEGRKMKTMGSGGETGTVELMQPMYDQKASKVVRQNDITKARYDVNVDVGPSSSSRRAATVRALTGMMSLSQDPQTLSVLQAATMMNIEGEGLADIRDYFRKNLVRMGVVKPTDSEKEELAAEAQSTPPDPNAQYLQAAAQEAQAKAGKAQADTVLTIAKAEQSRAETAKTLSDMEVSERASLLDTASQLQQAFAQESQAQNPLQSQ